jgi:hypothetical protein
MSQRKADMEKLLTLERKNGRIRKSKDYERNREIACEGDRTEG